MFLALLLFIEQDGRTNLGQNVGLISTGRHKALHITLHYANIRKMHYLFYIVFMIINAMIINKITL